MAEQGCPGTVRTGSFLGAGQQKDEGDLLGSRARFPQPAPVPEPPSSKGAEQDGGQVQLRLIRQVHSDDIGARLAPDSSPWVGVQTSSVSHSDFTARHEVFTIPASVFMAQ